MTQLPEIQKPRESKSPRIQDFLIIICLLASFVCMVVGHVVIHGRVFADFGDRVELFGPLNRWVSDYAAVYPDGLWIKASILFFALGLICVFRVVSSRVPGPSDKPAQRFVLLTLLAAMCGGLLLVAIFDISREGGQALQSKRSMRAMLLGWTQTEDGAVLIQTAKKFNLADLIVVCKDVYGSDGSKLEKLRIMGLVTSGKSKEWWMSLSQVEKEKVRNTWAKLLESEKISSEMPEWMKERINVNHRSGFLIFVSSFVFSLGCMIWLEKRNGHKLRLPASILLFLLAIVCLIWLIIEQRGVAGIPQRALLALAFVWVIRLYGLTKLGNEREPSLVSDSASLPAV